MEIGKGVVEYHPDNVAGIRRPAAGTAVCTESAVDGSGVGFALVVVIESEVAAVEYGVCACSILVGYVAQVAALAVVSRADIGC